jgi:SAM-dependent methyltransferase
MHSSTIARARFNSNLLDDLQYAFLRRYFPGEPLGMDGGAYAGTSKLKVLLGQEIYEDLLESETVVDFGCGVGTQAIELATLGCERVIGVDIQQDSLRQAERNAREAGVSDRCVFTDQPPTSAAAILSLDALEHFGDPVGILRTMYGMLRPGGRVYASFGPTWYHPLGGHMFSVFPWAHLLFTENALCRWRSHLRDDGATTFAECAGGLNRMTIGRFERLVKESPLTLGSLECVPIRKLRPVHNRLTREFTSAIVRAVLVRD